MCKADVIVIKVHVKGIAVVRCVNANITILSSFASSSSLFWFRLFVGILDVSPSAGAGFNWRTFFLRDVYLELFLRSVGRTTSWSQNIPNTNTWSVDDRYACLCLHICVFVCVYAIFCVWVVVVCQLFLLFLIFPFLFGAIANFPDCCRSIV